MYLVDTNVLSEARRREGPARSWLRAVNPGDIWLSVVTLGEIMKGIARRQGSDPMLTAGLLVWLERLRRDHVDRILAIDDRVALEWGRVAASHTRGMADGLIAATAAVHGKIVVTRNVADFRETGVPIIDPWSLSYPSN